MEKRKNNWARIVDILKKHGLNITGLDYEPVMYLKKDAALDLIIK